MGARTSSSAIAPITRDAITFPVLIERLAERDDLLVVGAELDLATGEVRFFEER